MSEDLREGATATIEGLVSRADLNGKLVKLLKFSDGRWGTRLLDDTENVRVKPANLVVVSPGLAIVKDGLPFVQQGWFMDDEVEQSTRTIAHFKAAFVRSAPALGLSPEQVAAEQQMFDVPYIFGLGGGTLSSVKIPSVVQFLCNAMRLGVSSLSPERLRLIIDVADKMNALGQDMMDVRAVKRTLLPLGFPVREEEHLILTVALNLPEVCDAYVYSTTSDTVVAWRKTLNLDTAKLDRACRTVIDDANRKEKCTSRNVCFFCGASPLSQGVSLHLCPSCECVAYCCDDHRKMDRMIAHQYECGCKKPFVAPNGIQVTPGNSLCISRLATESLKEESLRVTVPAPPESTLTISRFGLRSPGMAGAAPIPMGWEINDSWERE